MRPAAPDLDLPVNTQLKKMLVISPWESMWSLGGQAGVSDDYRFVDAFTRNGYELHFLIPEGRPGGQPDLAGFHTHCYPNLFKAVSGLPVPIKRFLIPPLFNLFVLPEAFRLIGRLRPDVVLGHSHYSSLVTHLIRRFKAIPAGVKLFGVMDLVHTEWPGWKYLFKNFEQIMALKFSQDFWIVLDDGTRGGEILERQGVARDKIHFLPNGIDLDWAELSFDRNLSREKLGIAPDTFVVLFLARFVKSKRAEAVVEAIPVSLAGSNRDILFLFAGDGPARADCEALAARLEVDRTVRFIGTVEHSRVPELLGAADLFVSTSNLTNMSIPTCEALLCGVPVVAFDVGDTRQVVRDGETGYVVADGDVAALGDTIQKLSNDRDRCAELGRRAKSFARGHFTSWEDRIRMELEIIDRWLNSA